MDDDDKFKYVIGKKIEVGRNQTENFERKKGKKKGIIRRLIFLGEKLVKMLPKGPDWRRQPAAGNWPGDLPAGLDLGRDVDNG